LRRQLSKWQNLENKEGDEVEEERQKRTELEEEVKDLEKQLKGFNKREQEAEKAVDREKRRVEKLKDALAEARVRHSLLCYTRACSRTDFVFRERLKMHKEPQSLPRPRRKKPRGALRKLRNKWRSCKRSSTM
jgi:septal ring factor EnvC (AmiA/AmiB activator)